jgi:site-specific DNA-methyltransferase (adenine-specific)
MNSQFENMSKLKILENFIDEEEFEVEFENFIDEEEFEVEFENLKEEKNIFINQLFRKDILSNMLSNKHLTGDELFHIIMTDNNSSPSDSRRGDLYESLCENLVLLKCIPTLNYTDIMYGDLSSLKKVKNIKHLLSNKIHQGNNVSDISIINGNVTICFSIKYKKKVSKKGTDINDLDATLKMYNNNYKIGLFVKSKEEIRKSKKNDIHKEIFDKIIENNLLFDETDIIRGLNIFCERFSSNLLNIDEFIDFINSEYLLSPKQQLIKKLHQKMTELKFIESFLTNKYKIWCIAHKPRSGKSITILSICKYLLQNGYNKILIMTSVPATINSFIDDLEKYIDFKNINYKCQEEFNIIDETFNGIVFCSVQYLKIDGKSKKKDLLKKIGFDAIIADESHQGSSTNKTKTEILNVDSDVEEIRKNIKLNIFASGTPDKTKKYYGINSSCIYEWEIEDEAYMKELINPLVKNREDIINYMVHRHGNKFIECLENTTLNKDYSKHPIQVLMKHSIPKLLIDEIKEYNSKYNTDFGYNCSSLFALQQTTNEKGEIEYAEEFELCKTTDGIDILKGFFDFIISTNRMRNTIMKQIENTQTSRGSRKSTIEKPLLFIIYLPTHTRNNTISSLQKTFKQFLETYNLWKDYNIEYSNSIEDTGNIKEEYNEYIKTIMNKTKTENKKGCILLLGNKGSVGITYNDCDVTISLDDGHNLDNQKQRFSRALTEADGKTIGINVDMNIQRTYLYLIDIIQKHRRNTKTTKTNAEILYYLFEHNIFLFDPQQINNGKIRTIEIMSYYQQEAENIMKEIDDTLLLENLSCNDDMRDILMNMMVEMKTQQKRQVNEDLNGEQQDCPKGDKTKIQIDSPEVESKIDEKEDIVNDDEINLINKTLELCKYLIPYLAIISKSYKIFDFKEILINKKTRELIISFLKYKKIELNKDKDKYILIVNIMNNIIDNNEEIVNNIREIYSIAPANKLRSLIEKHFIPTNDEKKQNAEVPTPVKLVDEMLDKIPLDFWKSPQKVFEPCCGKGNFVLGIFDKFYKGLEEIYPDEIERCRIIMTECIYYADLTALNVFITTEIVKCHIQSYCGLDEFNYEFNNHIGNTLELNIEDIWNISLEEVSIIGNPPYSTDPSKPDTKPLYDKFIEKYIGGKLLLFVVPSRWFIGGKGLNGFRDFMMKRKDIVFIKHEDDAKKWFGNNIDIKGGVNYFLKDALYNGVCLFNDVPYDLSKYDCIIKPKYHNIIDVVINMESINKLYMGRYFGIETNDKRFKNNGKIKCYVSTLKSKDRYKYIDNYDFNEMNSFWKVITPEASFKAFSGFGEKFIGKPNEVHTGSYISFRVNNEEEAESLLSYLDTKFANYMLSVRKISQHINSDVCKWIPLVPLDRIWTDDEVCEYLNIEQNIYI